MIEPTANVNLTYFYLNLWGKEIGDKGAIELAANTTLTYLDLQDNKIGEVCLRRTSI